MPPRIRTVKPEFFSHHGLYTAEAESKLPLRVAFSALFTVADRQGRFKWIPPQLKKDCLPYDPVDMHAVLGALELHGFILRYGPEGKYGWIPGFLKHQRPNNKELPSTLPAPSKGDFEAWEQKFSDIRVNNSLFLEKASLDLDRVEGKGREGNSAEICRILPGGS
jgi:hypothetical protein